MSFLTAGTILAVVALASITVLTYQKAGHDHQYMLMDKSAAQRFAFVGLTSAPAPATVPSDEEEADPGPLGTETPGQYL